MLNAVDSLNVFRQGFDQLFEEKLITRQDLYRLHQEAVQTLSVMVHALNLFKELLMCKGQPLSSWLVEAVEDVVVESTFVDVLVEEFCNLEDVFIAGEQFRQEPIFVEGKDESDVGKHVKLLATKWEVG